MAVVREIKERHKTGQPVLVGTVSIEKNERLSAYLKKEGIPHQILNAKNHEQEAQIIAEAGRKARSPWQPIWPAEALTLFWAEA